MERPRPLPPRRRAGDALRAARPGPRQVPREARGGQRQITLDESALGIEADTAGIVAVDEALQQLAARDEHLAQIVEMRFFGGFSHPEIAAALQVSLRTVERSWRTARAFLLGELGEPGETENRD